MFVCPECGASQPTPAMCTADGSPLAPVGEDMLLGAVIGAYRIARLLGIGGMGRVYKGVHPQIGSRVAIKVLSRECSDRRDLVDRFFSEAKAVNLIRHESIVNVLDLSTLPDGRPYIVMEYLDGAPLAAIIEQAQHRGPLPIGGVARLAAEVLDALGAAHAKGIVHRDLKPDNIFITPAGHAKVLDFGIAKLQPELGGSATHTGSLLGTPHYMSPEQAAGRPVDLRADLYAMGIILFECTTLRKPFTADSLFDLLRKHVEVPPPSPRALRLDLPPELEHVIYTALAKHPGQRFASAQAMSVALQHATARLPQDQWAPITPSTSRPPSSGGWSPTPPASWAGGMRVPSATATAGQVTAPKPGSSRKALWIGIAAVVLVGGGVTAAVVAGDGGDAKPASPVTPVAPGSQATQVASGSAPAPPIAPVAPVAPASSDDDLTDVDGQIQAMLDDEDVRAALPPSFGAAVKKYGSWAKVPKAERAKLAAQVTGLPGLASFDAAANALANVPSGSPSSNGWITPQPLAPPGFDPKKANADAFVAFAIAKAKQLVPDAQLTWISVDGVYPDGHADLTLRSFASNTGSIDVRFVSPSHTRRDPKLPRGVRQELKCAFRIDADPSGSQLGDMITSDCKEQPVPRPRCTLAQVWKKALTRRKDLGDAVAEVIYMSNIVTHKIVWAFEIRDNGESIFSEQFPDDC